MFIPGLLFSIALPLLAGVPWMLAMQSQRAPGSWALAIAYGYVLGLLLVVGGIQAIAAAHLPVTLLTSMAVPVLAALIGCWRMRHAMSWMRSDFRASQATWQRLDRGAKAVVAVALALIVFRLATLAAELLLRPVFPWETVSAVAAKARVWFELSTLAPFVTPGAWLEGLGSYTDTQPGAPALPSLLLVWTARSMGQWQESAVGFPWWMLGVSMMLATYGHLRRAGSGVAFSISAAYVFLSLPLVNLHIALVGAPQWIAAAGVGIAGCALLTWLEKPTREMLCCLMIGTALALLSLYSTWPWILIFAIAIAMRRWPSFAGKLAIGIPLVILLLLLASMQMPLTLPGRILQLKLSPAWGETLESLFLLDNWHLLYGIALLVALAGWRTLVSPAWLPKTAIVIHGFGLLLIWGVFSLPGYWFGGLRDFSYAALQFAPILVLWTALAARAISVRETAARAEPKEALG